MTVVDSTPAHEEFSVYQAEVVATAVEPSKLSSLGGQMDGPPQCRSFVATLQRTTKEAPWGLKVDFADDRAVHICEVRPISSPASVYNESAPPDEKIRAGDYIIAVNSASANRPGQAGSGADALRDEMKAMSVELKIVRPERFERTIQTDGHPMGLELNFTHKSSSLVIMRVCGGAVSRCAPDIIAGDRIVGVDDVQGTPEQLLEAIRTSAGSVVLKMSRPLV